MSLLSLRDDRGPDVAVEIAGHAVSAVRLERRGRTLAIAAHATEPLPSGLLTPSLTVANVQNRSGVMRILTRVLDQVGRPRRVGLVVPDPVAKLSMLKFQHVPAKAAELDQLIRWQLKKSSPFPIEDAQIAYAPAAASSEGQEFLVSVARTAVIAEYESLCAEAGAYAGLVDASTPSVLNAVLAIHTDAERDLLVVNVSREWASLAILRAGQVVLLRSREAEGEDTLADLVHQTAMYYEDRLSGAGFGQVLLCGATSSGSAAGTGAEVLRRGLEERLGTKVVPVNPTLAAALTDRATADAGLMDALAPAIGLLMRYREVAA